MRPVAAAAALEGRTLLLTWTSSLLPAADAFMTRLGAQEAQVMLVNQLDLADLNQEQVGQWLRRGESLGERYELGFWDGPYPEADLDAIVEMRAMMNTMPRDKLAVEDERWTATQLRQHEGALLAQRTVRHTAYVRDRATGAIAGFTEVFRSRSHPEMLVQGDTAVAPDCRGLGIATWLKAAMIERALEAYPERAQRLYLERRLERLDAADQRPDGLPPGPPGDELAAQPAPG